MYSQTLSIKDEHIDFQGILDGLYYPYYMEKVRHDFMRDVFDIDIVKAADEGKLYVLASYELKFKNSLKKGDQVEVTCELTPISNIKFGFYQKMLCNGKVCAEANFIATCIPAAGGRPFVPDEVKEALAQ
ncbi:acyl-CoA thioesterase [Cysteiniphilum halobium]|uniref:acyl-CoA thioesterase n=1 Tax=Cysteiniphilum halobium TaxID=2219059 RepID=UPI000E64A3EA|nr:thioesterase family protein [Cysteiniphilum halobium]